MECHFSKNFRLVLLVTPRSQVSFYLCSPTCLVTLKIFFFAKQVHGHNYDDVPGQENISDNGKAAS